MLPLSDIFVYTWFSQGLYAENAIDVARREMAWEVDYLREAKNAQQFRLALLSKDVK